MDITELKRARDDLLKSSERLETILVSLPIGVVVIDRSTKTIVEANPAALSLIGAPLEEVIGRTCHRFICPAEKGRCPITDLGNTIDNSERILLDSDGNSIPIQKMVIPVEFDNRQFLVECFLDIRAQKRVQEEREAKEKLQGVIEMAGAVCHELNQPMQALIGYADLLAFELSSQSPLRSSTEGIKQQVRDMSAIMSKLVGINRYRTQGYLGDTRIRDIDRASGAVKDDSE
jgi:PAS domain S-box-containing protein